MAAVMDMSPYAMLRQLEQLGRHHGAQLPTRETPPEVWEGVGFRLGSQHFVTAMSEVSELLKYPELSPVPRTRAWVRGMANVRGNLLPVMDLAAYLGGLASGPDQTSRVIAIDVDGVYTGLLVDEVFGMRHFPNHEFREVGGDVEESVAPYVEGMFRSRGEQWLVFSMRTLARSPRFMKVAA